MSEMRALLCGQHIHDDNAIPFHLVVGIVIDRAHTADVGIHTINRPPASFGRRLSSIALKQSELYFIFMVHIIITDLVFFFPFI